MLTSSSHRFRTRFVPALALVATAMVASGCGGGSGNDASSSENRDSVSSTSIEPEGGGSSGEETGKNASNSKEMSLTFAMSEDGVTPTGYRRIGAKCDDDQERGSWITFAVPEDWEATSWGAAGGGSPTNGALDHGFKAGAGEVEIKVAVDDRDEENQILNASREPSESFDYEVTVGDVTKMLTHSKSGTVDAGDQSVDVFKLEKEAFPAYLGGTTYVARLHLGVLEREELTDIGSSSRLSVSFDPEEVALTEEAVLEIFGSVALPECSQKAMIVNYEVMFNVDLDGDGKISTTEGMTGRN